MSPNKICVGAIFRKYDEYAEHFKYYIIVADKSGEIATIYINTTARYSSLPTTVQSTQFPLTKLDYSFLDHDSFADCGTIKEFKKSVINEHLQSNNGHHCGHLSSQNLDAILRVINTSKVLEKDKMIKYGFGLK